LEVHSSRASAVIVQQVPPDAVDWFMEWQRGVDEAAKRFAGFRQTDIYPPGEGQGNPWVVAIHFDDEASLQKWLASPERAQLVEQLRARAGDFELQTLPGGFGAWFTSQAHKAPAPPAWKIVISVVLGLFPTVMLLAIFPGPYTSRLGFAGSMLIGNLLSVSILQWLVMPRLTKVLAPWLQANAPQQKALSIGGCVGILVVMLGLVFLFQMLGIGEH
jgi:antibiotic biosynthesis monooxygenase (ABM) superfamily enzyme